MRVYFDKSGPDLTYAASRDAIGNPDSLLNAIEHAAYDIAALLYAVVGPLFWSAILVALLAAPGVL
jgi:hypothetical protein